MLKILDHGYIRLIEVWGKGDANVPEAGIIEAARQSTQGNFRGWEDETCLTCAGTTKIGETVICPNCNGKGYLPGDARLLKYLYTSDPKHATPFEFAGMVIEVQAPIFVFREWHRHRTQSYNEMSGRYSPLPDLNYMPTLDRCMANVRDIANKQAGAIKGADELTEEAASDWMTDLLLTYKNIEALYQEGLKIGIPKELARIPLPVGRYSRMRAQTNLRNWLAFMTLRCDAKAQWEIRQYANAVADLVAANFPHTFALWKHKA